MVLHNAKLEERQLHRWLIAYWCFYHVGTASILSEVKDEIFWKTLKDVTIGTAFPRGTERRHFRGLNADKSVSYLASSYSNPSEAIKHLIDGSKPLGALELMQRVRMWVGFGPWIAFKVADMIEVLGIKEVLFTETIMFEMFESPRIGAIQVYEQKYKHGIPLEENDAILWAYDFMRSNFGALPAPPRYTRKVGPQEIETMFCKFKSALGGHYYVGKDLKEVRDALIKYSKCKTSQHLLKSSKSVLFQSE